MITLSPLGTTMRIESKDVCAAWPQHVAECAATTTPSCPELVRECVPLYAEGWDSTSHSSTACGEPSSGFSSGLSMTYKVVLVLGCPTLSHLS